jgi:hypothetical protein
MLINAKRLDICSITLAHESHEFEDILTEKKKSYIERRTIVDICAVTAAIALVSVTRTRSNLYEGRGRKQNGAV